MVDKLIKSCENLFLENNFPEGINMVKKIMSKYYFIDYRVFMLDILEKIYYDIPILYQQDIFDHLVNSNNLSYFISLMQEKIFPNGEQPISLEQIKKGQSDILNSFYKNKKDFYYKFFLKYNILIFLPQYQLTTELEDFYKVLTENNEVIKLYTHKYDYVINTELRKNYLDSQTKELVLKLINLVNVCPSIPITLYRGVNLKKQLHRGDIYEDTSFISKTLYYDIAKEFMKTGCCLLMFTYENNPIKQLYLQYASHYQEGEFISYPHEKYLVTNIYTYVSGTSFKTIYHCEYIYTLPFDLNNVPINHSLDVTLDKLQNEIPEMINSLDDKSYIIISGHNDMIIGKTTYYLYTEKETMVFNYLEPKTIYGKNFDLIHLTSEEKEKIFFNDISEQIYLEIAADSCNYIYKLDFTDVEDGKYLTYIRDFLLDDDMSKDIILNSTEFDPKIEIIYKK